MKLPGFNADASLNRALGEYRIQGSGGELQPASSGVIAARQAVAGCGACTELKWPNGTGTGVCRQDCCDDRGNCSFQSCPCGGGGARSIFSTRSFTRGSFARL